MLRVSLARLRTRNDMWIECNDRGFVMEDGQILAIDDRNPQVQRVLNAGFKLAYHEHLKPDGRIVVSYAASDKRRGLHLQGLSNKGDRADAMDKLLDQLTPTNAAAG